MTALYIERYMVAALPRDGQHDAVGGNLPRDGQLYRGVSGTGDAVSAADRDAGRVAEQSLTAGLANGGGRWPMSSYVFRTSSPVSRRDLRLDRMRGQPPETASMSFESARSIAWVMVSLTAPSVGSSAIVQDA